MFTTNSSLVALAQLHIETSVPAPATVRVVLAGEVDLATAPALREHLLRVLRQQRPGLLDVDLAEVTFLDCAGIGALVAARNAAAPTGCQVRVIRPRPMVRRIMEVTGLLGIFTAAVGQPRTPPAEPERRSWVGRSPAPGTQSGTVLAAA